VTSCSKFGDETLCSMEGWHEQGNSCMASVVSNDFGSCSEENQWNTVVISMIAVQNGDGNESVSCFV
jgi:hypothetical protein